MYLPAVDDESTTLTENLRAQLGAIRTSLYGLDEEQARSRPLRSELSLGGLLTHATWCMVGALTGAGQDGEPGVDPADFFGNFALAQDVSLPEALDRFDRVGERYLALVASLDLDATISVPPMPWYGVDEAGTASMRYLVVHHVEEFARHAGHADIIREQIDGATAASLDAAAAGRPANDYVTPWAPA